MEHRKTICTSPKCMRATPAHQIASHCNKKHKKHKKHKKRSSKLLRAFMEFVKQLRWSPFQDNKVVEDGLARTLISRLWMGFNVRTLQLDSQISEHEAAYRHKYRSVIGCIEWFLVRIQSWSGEVPYWLVNESECSPISGDTKQSSGEQVKLEIDEQADRKF